ncbi:MAG: hypothetical protein OZ921_06715 [Sorangiineae bacterium]|nr:hypothetical protein [Polyangiaceae bacterium]MEB2322187.1 hypothetical protein [Sorangiineae bacterium]
MSRSGRAAVALVSLALLGCTAGEGEGWVRSERLFIEDCWNGKFDLKPDFFAANPSRDTQMIRVQRGDNIEEMSDGLMAVVTDVGAIRRGMLGQALSVGLPVGVHPPGTGLPTTPSADPPRVSLALYLHDTCHGQNGTLYSIDGTITFNALFSGDRNESSADERLTDAEFEATFADPRDLQPDGTYPPERTSTVRGWFRFFFQRGQPAQPFP